MKDLIKDKITKTLQDYGTLNGETTLVEFTEVRGMNQCKNGKYNVSQRDCYAEGKKLYPSQTLGVSWNQPWS